ncbi:MAG: class I SAM-dependent DNA methyltransferase [Phycisphaerales bacterium]
MPSTADAAQSAPKAPQNTRTPASAGPSGEAPGVGVMGGDYAVDRTRRPHLAFRYQVRALVAANMYRRFGPGGQNPSVLDLGAADGRAMVKTHELLDARRSVGIEFSEELIAAAGGLPEGCCLVQGDATKPHAQVPKASFDLVTALAVLEHVENPVELCTRVREALVPGGVFVATCPSGVWDSISGAVGLHKDEHHTGAFNRARFESVARDAGLTPLHYERFMLAPVGFLPYMGVRVSPRFALAIDRPFARIPLVNLAMVNQVFVGVKPAPTV